MADPAELRAVRDLVEAMGFSGRKVSADAMPVGRVSQGPALRPSRYWQSYDAVLASGELMTFPLGRTTGLLELTTSPPNGETSFDSVLALLLEDGVVAP